MRLEVTVRVDMGDSEALRLQLTTDEYRAMTGQGLLLGAEEREAPGLRQLGDEL